MHARLTISVAMLVFAAPVVAQPANDRPAPSQPQQRPARVILASAETVNVPTPNSAQQGPEPVKKRVGRVTTCRCGDVPPEPDSEDQ